MMEHLVVEGMEWLAHEQLVLGLSFIFDNLLRPPLSQLVAEDFFAPAHREAFTVMKRIATVNGVNPSRVSAELPSGALHKAGGEIYLFSLFRNARGRLTEAKESVEFLKNRSGQLGRAQVQKLAAIDTRPVEWLWRPYLPSGMVAMLSGDPGVGKTYLALAIAAAVTTGRDLVALAVEQSALSNQQSAEKSGTFCRRDAGTTKSGDQRYKTPADVLYLSVENSPERVVRPRFDALGGDPARFHLLQGVVQATNKGEVLTRARLSDMAVLGEAIRHTGARLLIVDPVQSFLDAKMDRTDETRPVVDALCGLAEEHGCAVLLIRHLSKANTGRAVARGMGSIDLTGAVRSEILAGSVDGDGALVHVKSNVGELGPALGYAIDAGGRFQWTGESTATAAALLAPEKGTESPRTLVEAEDFLRQQMDNGHAEVRKVMRDARLMGITERTLRRAKVQLRLVSHKQTGPLGAWYWEQPGKAEATQTTAAAAD
jgi:KaiC/GvpD/RAD55 family RecA-like ATPase